MSVNLALHCGPKLEKYIVDTWEDTIMNQVGIHYLFHFPNGYGASVIKTYASCGFKNNKWELVCILYDDENLEIINPDQEYKIIYPYEIMHGQNFLGNLSDKEVRRILYKIMKLK